MTLIIYLLSQFTIIKMLIFHAACATGVVISIDVKYS